MQLKVFDQENKPKSDLDVTDGIFASEYNEALIHQVVTAQLAGLRAGTQCQKTKGEVRGGGKKPWRQKGTGRARAGSSRSPIWRSGGVTFAAKPRSYKQKVNRKMYTKAMCSILSELIRQERLVIVENIEIKEAKTKLFRQELEKFNLTNVLVVTAEEDGDLYMAGRNIPNVDVVDVASVEPISLIGFEKVMITVAGLKLLEERLA